MIKTHVNGTLDIHGGARDLIFPHHENEIAQSEAGTKQKFCRCWIHTGFLTVNGEKMSKSLGNFITLKQALSKSSPNALRLFYLQAHYRSPLDYDEDNIEAAEESVERIFNSLGLIRETLAAPNTGSVVDSEFRQRSNELISTFYIHMEDDFNTPEAIASVYTLLRVANTYMAAGKPDYEQLNKVKQALDDIVWILGLKEKQIGLESKADQIAKLVVKFGANPKTPEENLEQLIKLREDARKAKDYKRSDEIRDRLKEIGVLLEDKTGNAARWKLI
jgi:cysteinyl-tRNA synthetase